MGDYLDYFEYGCGLTGYSAGNGHGWGNFYGSGGGYNGNNNGNGHGNGHGNGWGKGTGCTNRYINGDGLAFLDNFYPNMRISNNG
jgi:hypothetical protein